MIDFWPSPAAASAPGNCHGRLNDGNAERGNIGAEVGLREAGEPLHNIAHYEE